MKVGNFLLLTIRFLVLLNGNHKCRQFAAEKGNNPEYGDQERNKGMESPISQVKFRKIKNITATLSSVLFSQIVNFVT